MRSLISIADLTNDEIEEIFSLADSADQLRADQVGARADHGDACFTNRARARVCHSNRPCSGLAAR